MTPLFLRVAALSPRLSLGNVRENKKTISHYLALLEKEKVQIALFPELFLTGSNCGDVFFSQSLQQQVFEVLTELLKENREILTFLGLPLAVNEKLYNVTVAFSKGKIWGIVPKNLLNAQEQRWFSPLEENRHLSLFGQQIPFGGNLFFSFENISFSILSGENFPTSNQNLCSLLFNPQASFYHLGQEEEKKADLHFLSKNHLCAIVQSNQGMGASTTDQVFSGQCDIFEIGNELSGVPAFSKEKLYTISDIDIGQLYFQRQKNKKPSALPFEKLQEVPISLPPYSKDLQYRTLNPLPFVPKKEDLDQRVLEVFNIQSRGLQTRLEATGIKNIVLGVSGGLDSTLALLAACYTLDEMGLPRTCLHALVMPGFGTTKRTKTNGLSLVEALGVSLKEINITPAVKQHFKDLGHPQDVKDITYENSQARERTQLLMDYSNMVNGLVLGTGNLSEIALGFSTYNADHMSMYNINSGIPKTLVKVLVQEGGKFFSPKVDALCKDIVQTPISPELLPANNHGEITQKTEDILGSYNLHDFFLYHLMDSGSGYEGLLAFATKAFENIFSKDTIEKALQLFIKRFYQQQFKRSCMPDGPQVLPFSLSPRDGWKMPSDLSPKPFLP